MFQESFRNENIVLSEFYSLSVTEALPENQDFYQSHVSQSEKALSEMKKSQTLRINHEMISLPQPVMSEGATFPSGQGWNPCGHSLRLNWGPSCWFQIIPLNLKVLTLLKPSPHCSELINIVNSCLSGAVGGCQEWFVSTRANNTCLRLLCRFGGYLTQGEGAKQQREEIQPKGICWHPILAVPTPENIPSPESREKGWAWQSLNSELAAPEVMRQIKTQPWNLAFIFVSGKSCWVSSL